MLSINEGEVLIFDEAVRLASSLKIGDCKIFRRGELCSSPRS